MDNSTEHDSMVIKWRWVLDGAMHDLSEGNYDIYDFSKYDEPYHEEAPALIGDTVN